MRISCLSLLLTAALLSACSTDPFGVIKRYGYQPTIPSKFNAPGRVYAVQTLRGDPWKGSLDGQPLFQDLCNQDNTELAKYWIDSPGITYDQISKVEGSSNISLSKLEAIKADARFKSVKNIRRTVSDVKFLQMTDQSISIVRNQIAYNNPDCLEVVRKKVRQGYEVRFSQSVVQATIAYEIEYERAAEANVSIALAEALAPSLGTGLAVVSANRIKGSDIYIGLRPYPEVVSDSPELTAAQW